MLWQWNQEYWSSLFLHRRNRKFSNSLSLYLNCYVELFSSLCELCLFLTNTLHFLYLISYNLCLLCRLSAYGYDCYLDDSTTMANKVITSFMSSIWLNYRLHAIIELILFILCWFYVLLCPVVLYTRQHAHIKWRVLGAGQQSASALLYLRAKEFFWNTESRTVDNSS